MMKVIKTGLFYLCAIALAVGIMYLVDFAGRYKLTPRDVYKVYLDGKVVGNIENKKALENRNFLKLSFVSSIQFLLRFRFE